MVLPSSNKLMSMSRHRKPIWTPTPQPPSWHYIERVIKFNSLPRITNHWRRLIADQFTINVMHFTHRPLGDVAEILKYNSQTDYTEKYFLWNYSAVNTTILLMRSQHWFWQQAITCVSQCRPRFMSQYGITGPQWTVSAQKISVISINET